jgi:light-regulated signal transduction histidine kinase (bacteriophytochrome)
MAYPASSCLSLRSALSSDFVVPNNRRSQSAAGSEGPSRTLTNKAAASPSVRHELEAEIALYRHALEKGREEFKAFAYAVSHDLRAPLRAIEGFSKILLEDFSKELSAEPQRFLNHIIANTQQLSSQLDDLLKFYRSSKHEPTKIQVNPNAICQEILSELDGQLSGVTVVQEGLPRVLADPVQLREIFLQLLSNALKYSAKSGKPRIEIGARKEPGATTFFVRDNGIGFDTRKAEKLFQVFQKMHSPTDFPGNGIGLAIAKRLVEAHGGCISAEAEPGKGAVFCFSLPAGNERLNSPPKCAVTIG